LIRIPHAQPGDKIMTRSDKFILPRKSTVLLALSLMSAFAAAAGAAEDTASIVIQDFSFAPASLTVHVGTTVTWRNLDPEVHTVVSDTGLFRAGALDQADTFTYRFDHPGTYRYLCGVHPKMVGTIVVEP
jgi:plastocyanin